MGLDNGIMFKIKNKEKFGAIPSWFRREEWEEKHNYDYEMNIKNDCYLNNACAGCKFLSICEYKCPAFNFNRSHCKDTFMYKMYDRVDKLLAFM